MHECLMHAMHAATNYCWIVMAYYSLDEVSNGHPLKKWKDFSTSYFSIIKYVLHTDFLDSEELECLSHSIYVVQCMQLQIIVG